MRRATIGLVVLTAVLAALPGGATASGQSSIRGAYGEGGDDLTDFGLVRSTGFNAVTAGAYASDLDQLATNGLSGLVWLGGYSNSTCQFNETDSWVISHVQAIAGHPAIMAYQIDDEPNSVLCPSSPAQIRARSDLVHWLDPSRPTYVVVSTWDGVHQYPYAFFAGTTDVMGVDVYPCNRTIDGCDLSKITGAVAALDAAGVPRYWAIMQAFGDSYYKIPTARELTAQFRTWRSSRMEGYWLYTLGALVGKPRQLQVVTIENSR